MSAKSRSNYPHQPNPEYACERCLWGTGEHSTWCERRVEQPLECQRVLLYTGGEVAEFHICTWKILALFSR